MRKKLNFKGGDRLFLKIGASLLKITLKGLSFLGKGIGEMIAGILILIGRLLTFIAFGGFIVQHGWAVIKWENQAGFFAGLFSLCIPIAPTILGLFKGHEFGILLAILIVSVIAYFVGGALREIADDDDDGELIRAILSDIRPFIREIRDIFRG